MHVILLFEKGSRKNGSEVCLVSMGCQLPEAAHPVLYLHKVDNLEYYVQLCAIISALTVSCAEGRYPLKNHVYAV